MRSGLFCLNPLPSFFLSFTLPSYHNFLSSFLPYSLPISFTSQFHWPFSPFLPTIPLILVYTSHHIVYLVHPKYNSGLLNMFFVLCKQYWLHENKWLKTNYLNIPHFFLKQLHKPILNRLIPTHHNIKTWNIHHIELIPLKLLHFIR
jgi:hypothetical protein